MIIYWWVAWPSPITDHKVFIGLFVISFTGLLDFMFDEMNIRIYYKFKMFNHNFVDDFHPKGILLIKKPW